MTVIAFTVLGRPASAGSKRAFAKKGGGVIVAPDDPRQKGWQADVRAAALQAFNGATRSTGTGHHHDPEYVLPEPAARLLDGPLRLDVTFYLRRPKGHYGTGRNAGQIKRTAPWRPAAKPDVSKLLRAVEDGLSGIVIADDARFVTVCAEKHYGMPERAEVVISDLARQARLL